MRLDAREIVNGYFLGATQEKTSLAPKEKMPQDYFLPTRTGGEELTKSDQRGVKNNPSPHFPGREGHRQLERYGTGFLLNE